ncbi:QacE family quaternary ammonium compound efflux SMR transporter [Donghicola sp. C2-DW-16]|uniref:QacE family quaternary ammonium compound efflux SMR transporter n=1 Tax=Donghicola mangrovi TaxID=2729614 RepID=A0A850PZ02_9RHOB|nr:SMR family transporter [Donghicola mangrovi]NVO21964.1 QacE family quaternary ammonium compound efflux SMR transporter [Donghicola mangrovi]NVO26445.1 QacE family quaternary ammonium compound efflux SMR transporter [Donghicola mangrovi]
MLPYLALATAIVCEVIGTSALKRTEEFTRLGPTLVTVVSYIIAFYLLTVTLRALPVGIVYAVWSGLGIVLISVVGWVVYAERLDLPALIGLGLILSGVVTIFAFSGTAGH